MVSKPHSPRPPLSPAIFGGNPPSDVGNNEEVPRDQQFKGHRQPPIGQRLEEAFNFLADEDPNRCLGFRDKLAEIDEYLAYIKKEKFQLEEKDETLFRNVKVMAETHHDWDARVQKGWIDTSCGTRPLIQPASNRLLTGSQVEELQREREAMGVEEQMRGEDPSFSVERSGDYVGFIKALGADSNQDPELVDDATNLLFVESRAYDWAVREPAWIPYWMHPTEGIPTTPIKPEDDEPWYQKGPSEQKGRTLGKPPKQTLPELLQKREFEVNLLLAKGKNRTNEEEDRLRSLVFDHFPKIIKMAWDSVTHDQKRKSEAQNKIDREIKMIAELKDEKKRSPFIARELEEIEDANRGIKKKTESFEIYSNIWYNWVQKSGGFQCVVESDNLQKREAYPETLGVLIYADEKCVDPKLTEMIDRANEIFAIAERNPAFWEVDIEETDKIYLAELLYKSTNDEWSYWVDPLEKFKKTENNRRLTTAEEDSRKNLLDEIAGVWKERFKAVVLLPPWGEPGNRRDTLYVPFEESKKSEDARSTKREKRKEMAEQESKAAKAPAAKPPRTSVDYTPQAERRGIQRAAIELGLNLLCGNHEQHRPDDKFRIVQLPGPYVDWSDIPEVPLTLPLDFTHRPVELEPFYFTEKVAKYRQQKDLEYFAAREQAIYERRGLMDPPANFKGPFSVASWEQYLETIQKALKVYERIYKKMFHSNETAPRPLMDRMVEVVTQAIQWDGKTSLPLNVTDEPFSNAVVELENTHINLLNEIAGDSWFEYELAWEDVNITAQEYNMARLNEFRHDVEDLRAKIPFWESEDVPRKKEDIKGLLQPRHDPNARSKRGISLKDILQMMNNNRVEAGGSNIQLWTVDEAKKYFDAMRLKEAIHYFDATRGEEQISLVPPTGHPENKYVVSLESMKENKENKAPGVYLNSRGHYEVRYDSQGTIGPCIVQPNKIEYLLQLSWHLGRCIKRLLHTLATYEGTFDEELAEVLDGSNVTERDFMKNLKDNDLLFYHQEWYGSEEEFIPSESLIEIALELHCIAPDLAERASIHFEDDKREKMTEKQAAILLQIQLLEENNNNWESRFPENEHVWDFAAPRLIPNHRELEVGGEKIRVTTGPRRYFNMRRYPVGCQTEATQLAIKSSGPTVAEKSDAKKAIKLKQEEPEQRPGEIYRGWNEPPNFPLGETPYQQAFLSWRMDQELADVPEFKTKSQKTLGAPPVYLLPPLPRLPSDFAPKSITPYENHLKEMKELMKLPDAPDPDILENYYTQKEIADIKRREAYQQRRNQAAFASKDWENMTKEEIEKSSDVLGIDPRSPKRQAETQPTGQTSPKKPKRAPVEDVVTDDDHTGGSIAEETGDEVMLYAVDESEDEATGDEVVTGDEGTWDEGTGEETGEEEEEVGEEEEAGEETERGEETGSMVEDGEMYDS